MIVVSVMVCFCEFFDGSFENFADGEMEFGCGFGDDIAVVVGHRTHKSDG